MSWCCFTTTTREFSVTESSLSYSRDKDTYGTLITIEGAWGYDLEGISFRDDKHKVLLEPGTKVRVKSVEYGSVTTIKVEVVERGKCLIDHVPVYEPGSEDGTRTDDDDNHMVVGRQKKLWNYERPYDNLRQFLLKEDAEQPEQVIMDVFGNNPRENKTIDYHSLMEYVNCDYGKLF